MCITCITIIEPGFSVTVFCLQITNGQAKHIIILYSEKIVIIQNSDRGILPLVTFCLSETKKKNPWTIEANSWYFD